MGIDYVHYSLKRRLANRFNYKNKIERSSEDILARVWEVSPWTVYHSEPYPGYTMAQMHVMSSTHMLILYVEMVQFWDNSYIYD